MTSFALPALYLFASLALASPALAQAGGFTVGDVWMSSDALHASPSQSGASLIRIDPTSGAVSTMAGSAWSSGLGSLGFDSYRHRLIWRATLTLPAQKIWMVDGAGNLTDMGLATSAYSWFASAGDGRIFTIENTGGPRYVAWIDAANRVHRVLNAAGTAPYSLPGGPFQSLRGLAYDAGTKALYACSHLHCDGLAHGAVVISKLPLSADGTRVAGDPTCVSFDIGAGNEAPVAMAHLPDGRFLITCQAADQSPPGPLPRLLAFDPANLSFSTFAMVGVASEFIDYGIYDGIWSSELGQAMVLDTFSDNLRTFAPGSSGDGSILTPVGGPVSPFGSASEAEQMAEISPAACEGGWVPFGTGLSGKGGFVPALMGAGCPTPGSGFTLNVSDGVGGAGGALFVGLAPATVPFKGGFFRVGAVVLDVSLVLGGTAGIAGAGTLSMPARLPPDPLLSGVSLFLQAAFTDVAAVKGVSLTQGLQLDIG